jgi:hypothetical protein
MYRFHYEFIKPFFHQHARLLFTDTYSLMYEIEAGYKQVYECFDSNNKSKRERLFDLSSLPANHFCHNDQNKRVIGKFKDERSGDPIVNSSASVPRCTPSLLSTTTNE